MQFESSTRKGNAAVSAKREREQRRQRRREEDAVTAISRWYRRKHARRRELAALRAEYRTLLAEHFPDEASLSALRLRPLRTTLPPGERTTHLALLLMRSLPPSEDAHLASSSADLLSLFRLLSAAINCTSVEHSYVACLSEHRYTFTWPACTSRLLVKAGYLLQLFLQRNARMEMLTVLKFMIDVVSVKLWGFLKKDVPGGKQQFLEKAVCVLPQVCRGVVAPPVFTVLLAYFRAAKGPGDGEGQDDVLTTAFMSLCMKVSTSPAGALLFVTTLLSKVQRFTSKLNRDGLQAVYAAKSLWANVFAQEIEKGGGEDDYGCLLGNSLEIGRNVCKFHPTLSEQFGAFICKLVERVPARSEMNRFLYANDGISDQIKQLWDQQTISLLFCKLVQPGAEGELRKTSSIFLHMRSKSLNGVRKNRGFSEIPTDQVPPIAAALCLLATISVEMYPSFGDIVYEVPNWYPACKMFNGLVYSFDPHSAINALSTHPQLVTSLWKYVASNVYFFDRYVEGDECSAEHGEVLGHILLLFLHSYDPLLAVTDEKEFYDLQEPFELSTVAFMTALFAKLAFRFMWDNVTRPTLEEKSEKDTFASPFEKQRGHLRTRLLLVSRSLLQHLQHKNTRKKFCSSKVWEIETFKLRKGFNFSHVLKYLRDNITNNPFENLFGVLRELTTEMLQSSDPLERHFGDIFGNLRTLFTGLHELYQRPGEGFSDSFPNGDSTQETITCSAPDEAETVSSDEDLKMYQALVGPMPYIVPYTERIEYMRSLVERDRQSHHASDVKFPITVRRASVLLDCLKEFHRIEKSSDSSEKLHLKAQLHVKFLNKEGVSEAGIDEGGLFKELLEIVITEAFSPDLGFFIETEGSGNDKLNTKLYPNPLGFSSQIESIKNEANAFIFDFFKELNIPPVFFYKFLGRVLAKAIYEGVVVEVPFAEFFLNTLLGHRNHVEDLVSLDPQLYKSIITLKEIDDVSALALTFSLDDPLSPNGVHLLVPRGNTVNVTHANLGSYISLYADYKLNARGSEQSAQFLSGIQEILPASMLALFNRSELQQLISGLEGTFEISGLRKFTRYEDYTDDHPVIESFWEVLSEFSDEEKGNFMRFVMSSARPPLLGFGHINPPFMVRRATDPSITRLRDQRDRRRQQREEDGLPYDPDEASHQEEAAIKEDWQRLPTSSTCFNLLCLPAYPTKEKLQERLLYAISSGTGFELS